MDCTEAIVNNSSVKTVRKLQVLLSPGLESLVSVFADIATVQSLDTPLEEINATSLNFWLCKFVEK